MPSESTTGPICLFAAVLLLTPPGCGGKHAVRPDDMSAEDHRRAAEHDKAAANAHAAQFSPTAATPELGRNPVDPSTQSLYSISTYNPTEWHHREAEKHKRHARQHEAAARELEKFQEAECKDFPSATRAACPFLGPAVNIQDLANGVAIQMAPGVRVDAIVAHMKCHAAYARAHRYSDATDCPLYLRGLVVKQGSDPSTIEITVTDRSRVPELRRLAYEEVIVPIGARP